MTVLCEHSQDLAALSDSDCWNRPTCKRSHSRILRLKYPASGLLMLCCGPSTMLGTVEDGRGGQAPLCPQEVHGLLEARDLPAGQLYSRQTAMLHRHHHFGLCNNPSSEEPGVGSIMHLLPPDVYILIPEPRECFLTWQKGLCRVVKGLEEIILDDPGGPRVTARKTLCTGGTR